MSINPLNANSAYNYANVVEKLFNHTLVYDDDYVQDNLVEVHIYLQTNDIQYPDGRWKRILRFQYAHLQFIFICPVKIHTNLYNSFVV